MKKRLVFYFYLTPELCKSEIYQLHLHCLKEYCNIFDEMIFVLSVDDLERDRELVINWESKLLSLFHTKGTITFEIHKNDAFRETAAFKKYVADRLGDEVLTFFGHGKGVTNIQEYSKEEIYTWITAMYYYNLAFMDEVEYYLLQKKFMSYGAFLTQNKEDELTKYRWYYIGTFFWVNNSKILSYMRDNEIEMPPYADRFFDEEFLGKIYDSWPKRYAYSHNSAFLQNAIDFYQYTRVYLDILYEDHTDFDNFYNKKIKQMENGCL